ncbi:hypothetical protein GGX14DRAFT_570930 [Mycena pura]|uniref:Uncharacterized protein n=1 Tax=Mycena pura TaxID=153505 RepID=A0AAD6V4B8_9AGAR|nr:hypothetical protein GGX14DRAFT_570930 [Mycena pura]
MAPYDATDCSEEGGQMDSGNFEFQTPKQDIAKKPYPNARAQADTTATRPRPYPKLSPFAIGLRRNILSGLAPPISSRGAAGFFDPVFGHSAARPERVYAELVNAYRLLRSGHHWHSARVPPGMQGMTFAEWMDRVTRAGILPEWWEPAVHRTEIDVYAREDAWGNLEKEVSREDIRCSLPIGQQGRMMSLEEMVMTVVKTSALP